MLVRFIVSVVILTALTQACAAQSDKRTQTEEEPITFSAFPTDKGTKNAEAEKLRNSGIEFTIKLENDRAIADFTKAIELAPKVDLTYFNRGGSYLIKKDYELAIADFTKAIEIGTNSEMSYIMRADAYDKIGRKDLAAADRQKFKELISKPKQ